MAAAEPIEVFFWGGGTQLGGSFWGLGRDLSLGGVLGRTLSSSSPVGSSTGGSSLGRPQTLGWVWGWPPCAFWGFWGLASFGVLGFFFGALLLFWGLFFFFWGFASSLGLCFFWGLASFFWGFGLFFCFGGLFFFFWDFYLLGVFLFGPFLFGAFCFLGLFLSAFPHALGRSLPRGRIPLLPGRFILEQPLFPPPQLHSPPGTWLWGIFPWCGGSLRPQKAPDLSVRLCLGATRG